jgi:putative DNA primase/helicase
MEWMRTGRKKTLVITQKEYADWLRKDGNLPAGIHVEHFNAIEGLDGYKDVRHLIVIGRTMPKPEAVEAIAGALTGAEPVLAETTPNLSTWYQKVIRSIRLRDGSSHPVEVDQHPDQMAEAVRWQICEGELIQAIGRARGVNRTATTPVTISVVADVVLPIDVSEVRTWAKPSRAVEMAAAGVMLFSPTDMAHCFPEVFGSVETAKRVAGDGPGMTRAAGFLTEVRVNFLEEIIPRVLTFTSLFKGFDLHLDCFYHKTLFKGFDPHLWPITLVQYLPAGSGQRPRLALFNSALVPHPQAWLEPRLGPLTRCDAYLLAPIETAGVAA